MVVPSPAVAAHSLPASELLTGPRRAVATRTRVCDSRASSSGQVTYLGGQTRAAPPGTDDHDQEQGPEDCDPSAHGGDRRALQRGQEGGRGRGSRLQRNSSGAAPSRDPGGAVPPRGGGGGCRRGGS